MKDSDQPARGQRYGVRSVWAHLAMCTATAVMLTLAFPWPGWAFMAYFALVPVGVLAMRTKNLWTLAWTSYLVFFVWWSLRVLWLKHVSPGAPFAMASVCAAYFSVALVILAAVQRRFRGAMTLTLPLFWCAQEFLRSIFPVGGFAWFTLASSQAAWRLDEHPGLLVQCADLFGWITVSFLVAMTSGLIVDLIARPLTKRHDNGALRPRRTIVVAALLWVGCIGGALIYGYQRIAQTPTTETAGTRSITIGIVQTNVPQSNKSEGARGEVRLQDFQDMLELSDASSGDDPRPDLIIWPETMVTTPVNDEMLEWASFYDLPGDHVALQAAYREELKALEELAERQSADPDTVDDEALKAKRSLVFAHAIAYYRRAIEAHAERTGTPLIIGSPARGIGSHGRSMNSALLVTPGDDTFERYSKMHLVPMGEYIPGPKWVRETFLTHLSPYPYDYTIQPGEGVVIFDIDAATVESGALDVAQQPVRFATPICYEDAVALQCRKMVYGNDGIKRADVLVNLTNDGWYPGSHQGHQHLQIAALRCIENRVPMARSVNTGVSGMIDSSGRVTALVSVRGEQQEVAGHVNAVAVIDDRTTLYGRVREGFAVGVCATAVLLFLGVFVPGTSGRKRSAKSAG